MRLKLLADECLDFRIIKKLRSEGFDVISVLEQYRSISDREVLKLAKENQAILITEDSDFGEWIFSYKIKSVGIIFLRYKPEEVDGITTSLISILNKYQGSLANKFTVIKINKIRIRDI